MKITTLLTRTITPALLATLVLVSAVHALPDPDGKPADMSEPVQVFIIMGQSNTLEFGKVKGDKEGSLEHAVKEEQLYPFMVDESGNWTTRMDVRNVHVMGSGGPGKTSVKRNDWLTVSGSKIGIETGIGHHLGNALDAPVLILKSSIGNRSLGWDLLPPGSPRHEVETTDRKTGKKITLVTPAHKDEVRYPSWTKGEVPAPPKHNWHAGLQYLGDVDRAQKALAELNKYYPEATNYEVAGFLWWQGRQSKPPQRPRGPELPCGQGAWQPLALQFLDPNITEVKVVRLPVVLKGNVSFQGTVADAGIFPLALLV